MTTNNLFDLILSGWATTDDDSDDAPLTAAEARAEFEAMGIETLSETKLYGPFYSDTTHADLFITKVRNVQEWRAYAGHRSVQWVRSMSGGEQKRITYGGRVVGVGSNRKKLREALKAAGFVNVPKR